MENMGCTATIKDIVERRTHFMIKEIMKQLEKTKNSFIQRGEFKKAVKDAQWLFLKKTKNDEILDTKIS